MPKIPTVDRPTRGVGGGPLTGPAISPTAASGFADIAVSAGKDLIRLAGVALKFKESRDNAKVGDYTNEYNAAARGEFARLKTREGDNARGSIEEFETWQNKWVSDNSELLDNDAQRNAAGLRVETYSESRKESLAFHDAAEHKRYVDSVAGGLMESAKTNVAVEPFNDSIYRESVAHGVEAINAANPGMKNKDVVLRFKADVATTKALAMMNVSPSLARGFIESAEGKTALGVAFPVVEKELIRAEVNMFAHEETAKIMTKEPDPEKQVALAQDIEDPDKSDATVALIKSRQADAKRFRAEREQETQRVLAKAISAAPSLEEGEDIARSAPPEMIPSMLTYAKAVHTVTVGPTDYTALGRGRAGIDTGRITSIEQLGVEFKHLVGKKWDSLVKYFNEGGNVGQIKDSTLTSSIQVRKQNFKPKENKDDAQLLQAVREVVEKNLEPGKFPTDKMVNDLVSTALMSGESLGEGFFGGDSDKTYIEAFKAGEAAIWVPEVTDANEIASIQAALKRDGDKVTDLSVSVYKRVEILKLPYTDKLKAMIEAEYPKKAEQLGDLLSAPTATPRITR